ncbi:hypothetical protein O181_079057 [Austropuccinia psidii MF-1]|uniref:Glutaredoxin n=1 Tax=Austropuccinia psidii MF-1 TaxID=1389203 RepID=A0A9Q3FLD0_9BASI|nr:hypothetical protein [Austropuccinia psidii MF-1]
MTSDADSAKPATNYHKLESPNQIQELLGADLNRLSVLYFRAEWAELCRSIDSNVRSLPNKWAEPLFLEIDTESLPEVAESFEVPCVPSFIILRGHKLLSRILGAKLPELETALDKFVNTDKESLANGKYRVLSETNQKPEPPPTVADPKNATQTPDAQEAEEEIFARCKVLMQQSKVVLFMKGDPTTPRCGFSQQAVKILQDLNVEFTSFDILTDDNIRQGMKKLNSWPTFPQIIVNGELIGGIDILKEMIQKNGNDKSEFEQLLEN